ncbi:hypothetical protein AKJ37_06585, partial [candidate division MSBL1 archaeon SCGC-AAA259I09]
NKKEIPGKTGKRDGKRGSETRRIRLLKEKREKKIRRGGKRSRAEVSAATFSFAESYVWRPSEATGGRGPNGERLRSLSPFAHLPVPYSPLLT